MDWMSFKFSISGELSLQLRFVSNTTNSTFTAERFYRFRSVTEVPLPPGQATTDSTLTYSFGGMLKGMIQRCGLRMASSS